MASRPRSNAGVGETRVDLLRVRHPIPGAPGRVAREAASQQATMNGTLIHLRRTAFVSVTNAQSVGRRVSGAFSGEPGRTLKTFTLAMNGGRTIVVNPR